MPVTPNSVVLPQLLNTNSLAFISTSTQNSATGNVAFTAGPQGSRISGIVLTSNDSSGQLHQFTWRIYRGANILFTITVTTNVPNGYDGNPTQPLMGPAVTPGLPVDQYGNQYIDLMYGDTIVGLYNGAIPAGAQLTMFVMGRDF